MFQRTMILCVVVVAGSGATEAWAQWEHLHKLTANDAAGNEFFGVSVAVSGGIAIVGVHRDNGVGENSGSAYLFDALTREQLHKLTADDAAGGDLFGISVSISGDIAIVGTRNGESAYLFDVTTGEQLHRLIANDAAGGDEFGESVSISGGDAALQIAGIINSESILRARRASNHKSFVDKQYGINARDR